MMRTRNYFRVFCGYHRRQKFLNSHIGVIELSFESLSVDKNYEEIVYASQV